MLGMLDCGKNPQDPHRPASPPVRWGKCSKRTAAGFPTERIELQCKCTLWLCQWYKYGCDGLL